jgi:hypothetical protein
MGSLFRVGAAALQVLGRLDIVRVRTANRDIPNSLGEFFVQARKEEGPSSLGFTGVNEDDVEEISPRKFLVQRLSSPKVRFVAAEGGREIVVFSGMGYMGRGKAELFGV